MKVIKPITITLFILVAVLWGVLLCGCKEKKKEPPLLGTIVFNTDSIKYENYHRVDTVYIHDTIGLTPAGPNTTVTGSGTIANPYVITAKPIHDTIYKTKTVHIDHVNTLIQH